MKIYEGGYSPAAQRRIDKKNRPMKNGKKTSVFEDEFEEFFRAKNLMKEEAPAKGLRLKPKTKKTRDKIEIHNPAYEVWRMKGRT